MIMHETMLLGSVEDVPALVVLPHSGLRIPDATLRVTSLRQQPTVDGVAFQAVLSHGRKRVGTVVNEGRGGATLFFPAESTPFTHAQLNAFAAACRTGSGAPCSTEQLLDELIDEHDTAQIVTADARLGRITVRLMAPATEGDANLYTVEFASVSVAPESGTAQTDPAAIARALATTRSACPDERWQYWTGSTWRPLSTPAATTPIG